MPLAEAGYWDQRLCDWKSRDTVGIAYGSRRSVASMQDLHDFQVLCFGCPMRGHGGWPRSFCAARYRDQNTRAPSFGRGVTLAQ